MCAVSEEDEMIRRILYKLGFCQYLRILIDRQNKLLIKQGMNLCLLPPQYKESLEYLGIELNIKTLDLKIEILKALLGIK